MADPNLTGTGRFQSLAESLAGPALPIPTRSGPNVGVVPGGGFPGFPGPNIFNFPIDLGLPFGPDLTVGPGGTPPGSSDNGIVGLINNRIPVNSLPQIPQETAPRIMIDSLVPELDPFFNQIDTSVLPRSPIGNFPDLRGLISLSGAF